MPDRRIRLERLLDHAEVASWGAFAETDGVVEYAGDGPTADLALSALCSELFEHLGELNERMIAQDGGDSVSPRTASAAAVMALMLRKIGNQFTFSEKERDEIPDDVAFRIDKLTGRGATKYQVTFRDAVPAEIEV